MLKSLYLNEKTSEYIIVRIIKGDIPISINIFDKINKISSTIYFHTTSIQNYNRLKNMSKKKQLSVFTKWSDISIFSGADEINNHYAATFILEGKYSFLSGKDMWTERDKQGRRWILVSDVSNNWSDKNKLFENISKEIKFEFIEILKDKDVKIKTESKIENLGLISSGKEKAIYIKAYFDATEKVLLKYKKELIEFQKEEFYDVDTTYNEIVAHDFNIKEILILKKFKSESDKLNISEPVIYFDNIYKLEDYAKKFINKL
jgi:hypothetical protein